MATPVSVVVPTRDRPEMLAACLAALRASSRADDELLVVDSASRDPAVARVAQQGGATVIRCERPGASRARNVGWRAASHAVVGFVDDDVRVSPRWAAAVATAFDHADDEVAFVTGRVMPPPGQEARQRLLAVKDDPDPARLDRHTPAPLGGSANVAVRRTALDSVGGFDEALGGGARFEAAEDLDLYDRLFAAGFVGRYEPSADAFHEQWRTRRELLRVDWRYGVGAGARLAKLLRTDRARARKAAGEAFWHDGLRVLGPVLRTWQEFAIATTALRMAGTLVGVVRALPVPVGDDGRFA